MERSEIIGPFRVNLSLNLTLLAANPKPNLNPKPYTKSNTNPHGPTSKGTPRAQKENLDKSYENMAINTKT